MMHAHMADPQCTLHILSYSIPRRIKHYCPLREDNRKSVPGFSWTPLCSSFAFPDFSLYLFTVINITMSTTAFLISENPSSELLRLWGVLGTPTLHRPYFISSSWDRVTDSIILPESENSLPLNRV